MKPQPCSAGVVLRPETPEDAAFVDGLVRDYLAEGLESGARGDAAGPLIDLQMRSRAAMLAAGFPDLQRRVGCIGSEAAASLLTATVDGALHVVEILVARPFQRKGVGGAVLALVAGEARARGQDVTANIFVANAASLALFARAGFTCDAPSARAQTLARLRTSTNVI